MITRSQAYSKSCFHVLEETRNFEKNHIEFCRMLKDKIIEAATNMEFEINISLPNDILKIEFVFRKWIESFGYSVAYRVQTNSYIINWGYKEDGENNVKENIQVTKEDYD